MTTSQADTKLEELEKRGHARRLGNLENYFALGQRQDLYSNFGMFCELDRACSENELAEALRGMCLEYPLLLHTVLEKKEAQDVNFYQTSEYLSKPWPQHDYIRVLQRVRFADVLLNDQEEYAEIVNAALKEFASNGGQYSSEVFELINKVRIPYCHNSRPNWRIMCFPEEGNAQSREWRKILLLSNHCSSDGMSSANFFHDLQDHLNNLPPSLPQADVIFDYSQDHETLGKLPAPIETQISYVGPKSYFAQLVGNQVLREYFGYKSPTPPIPRVNEPGGNDFYSYFLKITPSEVAAVKKKLKNKLDPSCTLTPFFQACWFAALYKSGIVFSKSFSQQLSNIMVAMNTAQLLPEDKQLKKQYRYGANVGGSHYNYQISSFNVADKPEAFWKLVRYYQDVFVDAKRKKHFLYPLGALMIDSIYKTKNIDLAVTNSILGKSRLGTMLSNVGYFPQKARATVGGFHIQDLIFAQTTGSFRFTFDINLCATDIGGLNITACVAEGALPTREDWKKLCELFKTIILES
ncbi:alcohol O-acetyltransferase [Lachancea thermotolerans CBS 6340]|uniref:KLTH0B03806p n=1 Tax=Lachancea thermotolerans (strain ATCC 56472 / CBS 6340 / NRRL Y-8284) TaxID=559295 RepID=C5DCK5_LACTC|nr:KLTH0B03806p [Lachancea thermotolerans CBS 6340]CAR21516.1 KLTH0B03806p [Lachancea thermotolerans CBS 6340]